jgi:hypothetical protein
MADLTGSDLLEIVTNAGKVLTPIVAGVATGWFRQRAKPASTSILHSKPTDRLAQLESDLLEFKTTQREMHVENQRQMKSIRRLVRQQAKLSDAILKRMVDKSL